MPSKSHCEMYKAILCTYSQHTVLRDAGLSSQYISPPIIVNECNRAHPMSSVACK